MKLENFVCVLTVIVISFVTFCDASAPAKAKVKSARARIRAANPEGSVKKRMANLVKRLAAVEKKVTRQQAIIAGLTKKMSRVGAAHGKFKDDEPCPVKVPGFYKASHNQINSCYLLAPSILLVNATEAEQFCQNQSSKAHIVALETETEYDYVVAKWKNERGIATVSRYWTDGKRTEPGVWRWMHSNKKFKYADWIPTSDHDDDRYACAAVYSNEGYYMADVACWGPHMITCEINL